MYPETLVNWYAFMRRLCLGAIEVILRYLTRRLWSPKWQTIKLSIDIVQGNGSCAQPVSRNLPVLLERFLQDSQSELQRTAALPSQRRARNENRQGDLVRTGAGISNRSTTPFNRPIVVRWEISAAFVGADLYLLETTLLGHLGVSCQMMEREI